MKVEYLLSTDELDDRVVASIRAAFPSRNVTIRVMPIADETTVPPQAESMPSKASQTERRSR